MLPNLLIIFFFFSLVFSQDRILSQWRGPNRDGVYLAKDLQKKWPDTGPEMLWFFEGLGEGHGTVAIANDNLYVLGMIDSIGYLYSFNIKGKLRWKKAYGLEWTGDYPGTRSTPTIVNNHLYFESGTGVVYCFDTSNGEKLWSVDLLQNFDANNIRWGLTESLLIDDDRIICTPGGKEHNVVALNRFTGKMIWTSKGYGEPAAYCSPILINHHSTRLIVTMTAESIIGIDADSGEFYWRIPQYQGNKIHANTPFYYEGKILCSSSSAKSHSGMVQLALAPDGKSVDLCWRNEKYTNLMGGVIVKDGFIYGARYQKSEWYCINWDSGEIQYIASDFGGGIITYADGLFYCYSEKGQLALVDITPERFNVLSMFEITMGTKQHWAHPVIHDGRLFVRHGDALMVYDIAAQ